MLKVRVLEHPAASVTVTLLLPAINPVTSSVAAPVLHKYEYGGVPPAIDMSIAPLLPLLQETFVMVMGVMTIAEGSPTAMAFAF